jgi:hypothetical protein
MISIDKVVLLCCLQLLLSACISTDYHDPSPEAQSMAGAMGRFDYQPADWQQGETTWWEDTDGVAPDTPGCHIGTDGDGIPNGRMFPEACLPDGLLVESNPGAGVLHSHPDDTGHPDKFDCNAWCIARGASSGACVEAPALQCEKSAKCDCD